MPDRVRARFGPDRRIYLRDHAIMAVAASAAMAALLWAVGNTDVWVAFVAAPLAIAVRGAYLASDELAVVWELTDAALNGPGRTVPLTQIETVRALGSAAQVVTRGGDKHLIKYLADPKGVAARIKGELR
ncbi:hypothetical protein ACRDNQ_11515 [Palleronia sp. KMU-117]|uniref:hypothetical protein n=1 Tax=Palleronia sp. KMU-117 TaxID=3434108 RepID=UPI003D74C2FD